MKKRQLSTGIALVLAGAMTMTAGTGPSSASPAAVQTSAAVTTAVASATTAQAPLARRKARKRGVTTVLPGIAQHCSRKCRRSDHSSKRAYVAGEVRFYPKRKFRGDRVVIQRKVKGGKWRTYRRLRLDRRARVEFSGKAKRGGKNYYYRGKSGRTRAKAARTNTWRSIFRDEFSRDTGMWEVRQPFYSPQANRSCVKAHKNNARVARGVRRLMLTVDPNQPTETYYEDGDILKLNPQTRTVKCHYKVGGERYTSKFLRSGHIGTENTFNYRYGIAAARIKFQRQKNMHGAFWTQSRPGTGESVSEADIAEYFGDKYFYGGKLSPHIAQFVHYDGQKIPRNGLVKKATRDLKKRDKWSNSYHIFSVEWTPRKYVFRIDGKVYRTVRGKAVSDSDAYLILSLVASDWELSKKYSDPATSKGMKVDWVRVWQDRDMKSARVVHP